MNQITVFDGHKIELVEQNGRNAITAEQLGIALDYSEPRIRIIRILNRNRDEFVEGEDYAVVKLTTPGGTQETTVFFHEGAILIAMFSNQPKAKAFRSWAKSTLVNVIKSRHTQEMENILSTDVELLRSTILKLVIERDNAMIDRASLQLDKLLARSQHLDDISLERAMGIMSDILAKEIPMTTKELARAFRTTEDKLELMYYFWSRIKNYSEGDSRIHTNKVINSLIERGNDGKDE